MSQPNRREVSEAEYTAAMQRHGSDEFGGDDADTIRSWHHQQADRVVEQILGGTDVEDDNKNKPTTPVVKPDK